MWSAIESSGITVKALESIEFHENAFALLGSLGLGFLEVHEPAIGGL